MPLAEHPRCGGIELFSHGNATEEPLRLQNLERPSDGLVDIDRRGRGSVRARIVDEATDDAIDTADFALDSFERLVRFLALFHAWLQQVCVTVDGAEGIADFVRDPCR